MSDTNRVGVAIVRNSESTFPTAITSLNKMRITGTPKPLMVCVGGLVFKEDRSFLLVQRRFPARFDNSIFESNKEWPRS